MFDVVQPDAFYNGHVVRAQRSHELRDHRLDARWPQIWNAVARELVRFEGSQGKFLSQLVGGIDDGFSIVYPPLRVLELDEPLPRHGVHGTRLVPKKVVYDC